MEITEQNAVVSKALGCRRQHRGGSDRHQQERTREVIRSQAHRTLEVTEWNLDWSLAHP